MNTRRAMWLVNLMRLIGLRLMILAYDAKADLMIKHT